ncbi:hypothetical protein ACOSQ3_014067 [Xanthoceras sorbifolium]
MKVLTPINFSNILKDKIRGHSICILLQQTLPSNHNNQLKPILHSNNIQHTLLLVNDPTWYADSGATNHVTSDLNNLSLSSKYKGTDKLAVGNGNQLSILNVGKSTCLSHSNPVKHTALNQMLHVPSISKHLLSVYRLTKDNNLIAEFCGDHYVFKDKMQASL